MFVKKVAVGDDITGEELPITFRTLAFLNFRNSLSRNKNLENVIPHLFCLDSAEHGITHLLFKT
jgi:hypothetical protein